MGITVQILFCGPPASRFSKAKRASVIGIGGQDRFCRTDFILSSARFKFLKAKRASGTQKDGWIVSDGLNLIARLFYVRY